MNGGTLFSGIGAPECASPDIDWRWSAEIDPFASAVHAARFPGVPNLGDVTQIEPDAIEPVDLVVFGSPCQSFSVAGRRLGLDDPRGNLALVALRLIGRIRPKWVVFENVPGLLSSDGGRDFGAFLGTVEQCGYGWAYRTLDAQFAGVPQRRRRVFVVGCLGSWQSAAAVLFEPESLRGDSPRRREAGERVARPIMGGTKGGERRPGAQPDDADNLIPAIADPISCSENRTYTHEGTTFRGHNLIAFGGNNTAGPVDVATACNAHGGPHGRLDFESETFVLRSDAPRSGVAKTPSADAEGRVRLRDPGFNVMTNAAPTVDGGAAHIIAVGGDTMFTLDQASHHAVASAMSVRRLLPVECEKLQGFAPGWTDISYRGKRAADVPRYRAMGNSMAVPVIGWVLGRIGLVDGEALR